jgi:SAM-dependent methyltransferase
VSTYNVDQVARHFVPRERSEGRNERLVELLRRLWSGDAVGLRICLTCGFGFADPFVDGGAEFYALVYDSDPRYPSDRWEFSRTLESLPRGRVVEIGAGDGSFLKRLDNPDAVAVEYDAGARARLVSAGIRVADMSELVSRQEEFDAVVAFQTVEHIADLDGFFTAVKQLLGDHGDLFVSMPNAPAVEVQERITGFYDLPPNHVGRWTLSALERAAERWNLNLCDHATEPVDPLAIAWHLADYVTRAVAYDRGTPAAVINAIGYRPLRGVLRRALAATYFPKLWRARAEFVPLTVWAHFVIGGAPR